MTSSAGAILYEEITSGSYVALILALNLNIGAMENSVLKVMLPARSQNLLYVNLSTI